MLVRRKSRPSGIADGVGVLAVRSFSGATPSAIEGAVTQLRRDGARSLALDLRGNGGGDLDAAVKAVDLFLDGGKTIATIRARTGVTVKSASGPAPIREPVVVLVDAGTASAAELFSAALSSNRRATLVGQQTYGKARVQRAAPIPGGGAVLVSRAFYETPAGVDVTGVGLTPDAPCATGEDAIGLREEGAVAAGRAGVCEDPTCQKARAVVCPEAGTRRKTAAVKKIRKNGAYLSIFVVLRMVGGYVVILSPWGRSRSVSRRASLRLFGHGRGRR